MQDTKLSLLDAKQGEHFLQSLEAVDVSVSNALGFLNHNVGPSNSVPWWVYKDVLIERLTHLLNACIQYHLSWHSDEIRSVCDSFLYLLFTMAHVEPTKQELVCRRAESFLRSSLFNFLTRGENEILHTLCRVIESDAIICDAATWRVYFTGSVSEIAHKHYSAEQVQKLHHEVLSGKKILLFDTRTDRHFLMVEDSMKFTNLLLCLATIQTVTLRATETMVVDHFRMRKEDYKGQVTVDEYLGILCAQKNDRTVRPNTLYDELP